MSLANDHFFMAKAIQLAKKAWYHTSPNPRVGCVIVKNQQIIGEGWHEKAGLAHAEINALRAAGKQARGATAYVSLEPCSHTGKTPPCANALIEAGIARVVYGMQDPNPAVAGAGLKRLQEAGIEVYGPVLEADAKALNKGFIHCMQHNKPWVFSKIACSLDGRTAMASGESQWITGQEARADVQRLRAESCAIITGISTVLADNPQLNVRDQRYAFQGTIRQPLRVIIDSRLRLPLDAKIVTTPGQCLVIHASDNSEKQQALVKQGVECIKLANANGQVDLAKVIELLAEKQCNTVMVEAGKTLNGALIQAGLIDELHIYMASTFLGSQAQPLAQLNLAQMSEQKRWKIADLRRIGDDVHWRLIK